MERFAPSHVGRGGFVRAMRLAGVIGAIGGFLYFYQRSTRTFFPRYMCLVILLLSRDDRSESSRQGRQELTKDNTY